MSKIYADFVPETTTKGTLDPNPLPPSWACQQYVFIAPSPVQCDTASPPDVTAPLSMLSWGLRVTGNGLDTTDACVSSCVHFLPQPRPTFSSFIV